MLRKKIIMTESQLNKVKGRNNNNEIESKDENKIFNDIMENEENNFKKLEEQSKNGLWMRWIRSEGLNSEVEYLKRTNKLSETQIQKYRHSQTEVKSKANGTTHWSGAYQNDFKTYAEVESDSESDDEMKKEKYPKLKAFTFKFDNCKIDDYRYSRRVDNNDIGVLVKKEDNDIIPICLQYDRCTGYTEFIHTPKKGKFGFYKNIDKNIDFTNYAKNPKFIKDKETNKQITDEIKELHKDYLSNPYMPYNEVTIRYKPEQIQAILINNLNEQSAVHALRFYLKLNEIKESTSLVFCQTERRSFKLKHITFATLMSYISEKKIEEQFSTKYWQLSRLKEPSAPEKNIFSI
jgi:hypothetical protein